MTTGGGAQLVNLPASYHNGASGVTFADGHAEIHKWRDRHPAAAQENFPEVYRHAQQRGPRLAAGARDDT